MHNIKGFMFLFVPPGLIFLCLQMACKTKPFTFYMHKRPSYIYIASYIQRVHLHAPVILRAPENLTVFTGESAVFTCETDGGFSGWVINGTSQEDSAPDITFSETPTNDGTTVTELIVPARAEYNGTRIQCLVVTPSSLLESDNATLDIQGIYLEKGVYSQV